jgi:hypothetical protein
MTPHKTVCECDTLKARAETAEHKLAQLQDWAKDASAAPRKGFRARIAREVLLVIKK